MKTKERRKKKKKKKKKNVPERSRTREQEPNPIRLRGKEALFFRVVLPVSLFPVPVFPTIRSRKRFVSSKHSQCK